MAFTFKLANPDGTPGDPPAHCPVGYRRNP
jgi:hypothetical protein